MMRYAAGIAAQRAEPAARGLGVFCRTTDAICELGESPQEAESLHEQPLQS